jgi:hypothetical protein
MKELEFNMRLKLASLVLVASCLPAMAALPALPAQGNIAVVSGRAHIERGAQGTYIHIENRNGGPEVAGFIPFGNHGAYPGWPDLEGRHVALTGVVVWNGRALIMMSDPDQLAVIR